MQALEILRRKHETVLLVVAAVAERLEAPEADSVAFEQYAGDLIGFFRHAGSCHDPKEDRLLTTLLHRRADACGTCTRCATSCASARRCV